MSKIIASVKKHFANREPPHTGVVVGDPMAADSAELLKVYPGVSLYLVHPWVQGNEGDVIGESDSLDLEIAKRAVAFAGGRALILRLNAIQAAIRVPCPRISFVAFCGQASAKELRVWESRLESGGLICGYTENGQFREAYCAASMR